MYRVDVVEPLPLQEVETMADVVIQTPDGVVIILDDVEVKK